MAREIPEVVRAVAGLTATVLDEARNLPRSLFGLPVRLLGMAMQTSLKLQQQYSGLVARGDEVFTGLWGESEPGMATFDEDLPEPPAPARRTANRGSAFDRAGESHDGLGAGVLTEEALTQEELSEEELTEALVEELANDPADLTVELSDEIADLSESSELDDVAGMADLVALADGDVPGPDTVGATADGSGSTDDFVDDSTDEAALADVLAFETLTAAGDDITDAQVSELPADPPADTVTETVDELAAEVDAELAAELPESVPDEVADDLAADTVATVADAEVAADEATPAEAAPDETGDRAPAGDSAPADSAPTASTDTGDASGTAAIEGIVADETASTETPTVEGVSVDDTSTAEDTAAPAENTASPEEDASQDEDAAPPAAATAPVQGYDGFSIPSLRGHLRGYTAETVADLLDYERATRARAPYITLLQNRLEKLSADRG